MDKNMAQWHLRLTLLPGVFAISRLPADAPVPIWAGDGPFVSITRTPDELSIVCPSEHVPAEVLADLGWRCLKVEGPFDLTSATGVLASLAAPLAQAAISLFALATYDTDYILIHAADVERAQRVLAEAEHIVESRSE